MSPSERWSGGVVRIATRRSELALWQANLVAGRIAALGHQTRLVEVVTQGDTDDRPFAQLEGQGFFTKAVQDSVLAGEADVAVHSFKDLPSQPHPRLEVAAIPDRGDPRDVLLMNPSRLDEAAGEMPLAWGSRLGTSAARRRKQVASLRPDLELAELRGNVPTRIEKLRAGQYDAIILAAAGLQRLGLDLAGLEVRVLEPSLLVPAPAQGALAVEIRRDDFELASVLTELHSPPAHATVSAERGLMAMLQGGCQLALGAHATRTDAGMELRAWYEGRSALVEHATSEGAAMLAFDRLGRPDPAQPATGREP